jgi:hypothetical protein
VDDLNQYLATTPPGTISNKVLLESLLTTAWDQFGGSGDGGMKGEKLFGRMESVVWSPPRLSFVIERHGATVNGSSRADLQHWVVDFEAKTATLEKVGRRQLDPMQPRLKVEPLAEEIGNLITSGQEHEWLTWFGKGRVRVLIGKILPDGSAVKQTLECRRKRLWKALTAGMEPSGWRCLGHGMFEEDVGNS